MTAIELFINGQALRLAKNTRLAQLMAEHYGDRPNMAVALNGWVITRADWPDTELNAGDRLEVFAAVAGG